MLSQIFHAVENLSSQPTDERRESSSRSNSTDSQLRPSSPLSSSQLAESALVNLRKSLTSQRAGSPALPKNAGGRDPKLAKSTLEDRLRAAAFTIGEASNPSSAVVSTRVSPTPPNLASQRPLSPSSTPLPESPKMSLEMEADMPLAQPVAISIATPVVQLLPSSPRTSPLPEVSAAMLEDTHLVVGPPSDPADPIQDLAVVAPVVSDSPSSSMDVEGLQERLKQVEQRFTGMRCSFSTGYSHFSLPQMSQLLSRSCRLRKLLLTWLYAN
jgi:hypothetical protein